MGFILVNNGTHFVTSVPDTLDADLPKGALV